MSKQLHYCNKTVTSEQFQSGGTEGLQVTRADCSHRQNFERERVYVRIIPCKGLQINSNLPSSIKFNRTSNGYPCAIFFFSMKIHDALFAKRSEFVPDFLQHCVLTEPIQFQRRRFSLEYLRNWRRSSRRGAFALSDVNSKRAPNEWDEILYLASRRRFY